MIEVISFDPGMKGGWAHLAARDGGLPTLLACDRLPIVDNAVSVLLLEELSAANLEAFIAIEVQQARPAPEGRASIFKTGRMWGELRGFFLGRGHVVLDVRSQDWKKAYRLTGKGKEASRAKAIQLFPTFAAEFRYKRDEGVAEACLIGMHEATKLQGGDLT